MSFKIIFKKIRNSLILRIPIVIRKKIPKIYLKLSYLVFFDKKINLSSPKGMNEKIRWLQLNTDTSKWTLLSDKYRVREFIKEKGYSDLLVPLFGIWDKSDDIEFDKLPNQFVIKTNHGSGSIYVINNKKEYDLEVLMRNLKNDLKQRYGDQFFEPHYYTIKPKIIAEELLKDDDSFSSSLVDYKFYCANGNPLYCTVIYNRNIKTHQYNVRLYDMNWKDCSFYLKDYIDKGKIDIPKPKNFDRMIKFCKDVCAEFPFVRMDFYEVNGKLYFGEFTFTPAACSGGSLSHELCRIIGEKIILPSKIS